MELFSLGPTLLVHHQVVKLCAPLNTYPHYWGEVPENLRAVDLWIWNESDLGKGYGT